MVLHRPIETTALTGEVGTETKMSGHPTNQELARVGAVKSSVLARNRRHAIICFGAFEIAIPPKNHKRNETGKNAAIGNAPKNCNSINQVTNPIPTRGISGMSTGLGGTIAK